MHCTVRWARCEQPWPGLAFKLSAQLQEHGDHADGYLPLKRAILAAQNSAHLCISYQSAYKPSAAQSNDANAQTQYEVVAAISSSAVAQHSGVLSDLHGCEAGSADQDLQLAGCASPWALLDVLALHRCGEAGVQQAIEQRPELWPLSLMDALQAFEVRNH